ncbi:MAG TPA: tRNA pseudouridine(38-40) synthase TruA [Thermomicrobiales bacterium]|nr:tRNA pseudouridine(38-40) synthase TruA [Thermomicrobiales bacterium]
MRRVRITLGYDGTEFFGSQSQPGRRTVQDELERLLQRLSPDSGRTAFAGRTDRGVHAVGQVVSVDVDWRDSDRALRDALNSLAPVDLAFVDVATVANTFHARYDARWREYRYRIVVAAVPPVFERRYCWWRHTAIDADLAADGCRRVVGEHAFGTFAGSGKSRSLPAGKLVRTVRDCDWRATDGGSRHELRIVASGFLPQMVRNITGAIVQVGSGRREPGWIDELIAANDRRVLGDAAPPEGLTLWRVSYPGDDNEQRDEASARQWPGEGYGEV